MLSPSYSTLNWWEPNDKLLTVKFATPSLIATLIFLPSILKVTLPVTSLGKEATIVTLSPILRSPGTLISIFGTAWVTLNEVVFVDTL